MRLRQLRIFSRFVLMSAAAFCVATIFVPNMPSVVPAYVQNAIGFPSPATEPPPTTEKAWPLPYAPDETIVTSEFDLARKHPISGQIRPHKGIDLACDIGTPIHATEAGSVYWIDSDPNGWGNTVWMVGDRPGVEFIYAHMDSRIPELVGKWVAPGTEIGTCGETGGATGPHLHFELIVDNLEINPRTYLEEMGLR